MTTAVVGDIHGDRDRLEQALRSLSQGVDELIFVGDYVDRGPDSRGVIERLMALQSETRNPVRFLRGNHDDALLQFIQTGTRTNFIAHGGLSTAQSYLRGSQPTAQPLDEFRRMFPAAHHKFLAQTEYFLERDGLLISHCGYNPLQPRSRSAADMVLGSFPKLFYDAGPPPQDTVIFGHYVQESGTPFIKGGLICIDTGCGTLDSNPLTAIIMPDREIVQF